MRVAVARCSVVRSRREWVAACVRRAGAAVVGLIVVGGAATTAAAVARVNVLRCSLVEFLRLEVVCSRDGRVWGRVTTGVGRG